jgi:hypothetical protein
MKNLISLLIVFILFSCTKEQPPLELFSQEAFAYYLDNSWELNASTRVKGFVQNEEEDKYTAKLSYSINLITPASDTLVNVDYGIVNEENNEEMMDLGIDSQIELDSAFSTGLYKIVFIVIDDFSDRTVQGEKTFELSAE